VECRRREPVKTVTRARSLSARARTALKNNHPYSPRLSTWLCFCISLHCVCFGFAVLCSRALAVECVLSISLARGSMATLIACSHALLHVARIPDATRSAINGLWALQASLSPTCADAMPRALLPRVLTCGQNMCVPVPLCLLLHTEGMFFILLVFACAERPGLPCTLRQACSRALLFDAIW
jgi:hypothetical protein